MLFISSWKLFVLKIFMFLLRLFGHAGETVLLERYGYLQNSWHHNHCPISHKVKATRQCDLVNWYNIAREIVFFRNYAENEAGRLVRDIFLFFEKA